MRTRTESTRWGSLSIARNRSEPLSAALPPPNQGLSPSILRPIRARNAGLWIGAIAAATLAGSAAGAPALQGPGVINPSAAAATNPAWESFIWPLLRSIYELLGGDPSEIDQAGSVPQAMNMVTVHYHNFGLPRDMTPEHQIALTQNVLALQTMMLSAPLDLGLCSILQFNSTLTQILNAVTALPR
jgi:hypothetical protein